MEEMIVIALALALKMPFLTGIHFTEVRAGSPTSWHQGADVQHELVFISGNSLPSAGAHMYNNHSILDFFCSYGFLWHL